jgi:hypothetical protein
MGFHAESQRSAESQRTALRDVIPLERSSPFVIPSERSPLCHSERAQLRFVIPNERSESRNRASHGREAASGAPSLSTHDSKSTTLGSACSRAWRRGLVRSSPISAPPRDAAVQRQEQQHFTRSSRRDAEARRTPLQVEIPERRTVPLHARLHKERLWGRHRAVIGAAACPGPLRLCDPPRLCAPLRLCVKLGRELAYSRADETPARTCVLTPRLKLRSELAAQSRWRHPGRFIPALNCGDLLRGMLRDSHGPAAPMRARRTIWPTW